MKEREIEIHFRLMKVVILGKWLLSVLDEEKMSIMLTHFIDLLI